MKSMFEVAEVNGIVACAAYVLYERSIPYSYNESTQSIAFRDVHDTLWVLQDHNTGQGWALALRRYREDLPVLTAAGDDTFQLIMSLIDALDYNEDLALLAKRFTIKRYERHLNDHNQLQEAA